MKDILQDVVKHTHSLGFLDIVKITGSDKETTLDSMAEDRSVIMQGEITSPVAEFEGTFGMPQLGKLDIHLKWRNLPENSLAYFKRNNHYALIILFSIMIGSQLNV